MPHIVSTLSANTTYANYHAPKVGEHKVAGIAHVIKEVMVNGGANVAGKLHTPEGVLTTVTEEELEHLEAHPLFKTHKENGFIKVLKSAKDPEKVAQDMTDRDESAPLNEEKGDFKKGGRVGGKNPVAAKGAITQ